LHAVPGMELEAARGLGSGRVLLWVSDAELASMLADALKAFGLNAHVPKASRIHEGLDCKGIIAVVIEAYTPLPKGLAGECLGGARIVEVDSSRVFASMAKTLREVVDVSYIAIGVDPGKTIGLGVVADARLVYGGVVSRLGDLRRLFCEVYGGAGGARVVVGVGRAPGVREVASIVRAYALECGLEALEVDEHSSNSDLLAPVPPHIPPSWRRHVKAASSIALRLSLGLFDRGRTKPHSL